MNHPPPRQTIHERARLNLRADRRLGFSGSGLPVELDESAAAVAKAAQAEIDALRAELRQVRQAIDALTPGGGGGE